MHSYLHSVLTSSKAKLWTRSVGDGVDAAVEASLVGNLIHRGHQGVGDGANLLLYAAIRDLSYGLHGGVLALHHGDGEEERRQVGEKHFLVLVVVESTRPTLPTVLLKGLLKEVVTSGKGNRCQLQVRPLLF